MVDLYYWKLNSNAILMFVFIWFAYPILFWLVASTADKYLSVGMQDLAHWLKISPTFAAVTLIAFANGAPDILSTYSVGY